MTTRCPQCGSGDVRERHCDHPAEAGWDDLLDGRCLIADDEPLSECLTCDAGFWPDGRFHPAGTPRGTQHLRIGDDLVASLEPAAGLRLTLTERGPLVTAVHGTDHHRVRLDVAEVDRVAVVALGALFDDPNDLRLWTDDQQIPCKVGADKDLHIPTVFHIRFVLLLLRELFAAGVDWLTFAGALAAHDIRFDVVDEPGTASRGPDASNRHRRDR